MIRITRVPAEGEVVHLRVEGRLTRDTVHELETAAGPIAKRDRLRLDLDGVSFADRTGIEAVRSLLQGGTMSSCSGFLNAMLQVEDETQGGPCPAGDSAEHGLVERLRRGDDSAYEELVRRHGGRMLATARRMLGNESDAEDAVQEAFLAAFNAIDRFAGGALLSTWLHRIVVNAALMKLRRRRRRPEESIDELLPRFDEQGKWIERVSGWESPAEEILGRRQTRQRMRDLIASLPETYRTVLLLRDIEDLDTAEVAAMLGIASNAVKVRLHRARQALRSLVERDLQAALPC